MPLLAVASQLTRGPVDPIAPQSERVEVGPALFELLLETMEELLVDRGRQLFLAREVTVQGLDVQPSAGGDLLQRGVVQPLGLEQLAGCFDQCRPGVLFTLRSRGLHAGRSVPEFEVGSRPSPDGTTQVALSPF